MRYFSARISKLALLFLILRVATASADIVDTYFEDFNGRQEGATIDGVDSWSVDAGATTNALTQDDTTYTGDGNSLELVGAETAVEVSRTKSMGDVSPCWVEFLIKPGVGSQTRTVPEGKVAALTFDFTGTIYASNGSSWEDTGVSFIEDEWYRVTMKLDFDLHRYDLYISAEGSTYPEFEPDKENLDFIDPTISSLSQIGFGGVYNDNRADDTYVDDLLVHFVSRLEIVTAAQVMTINKPSGPITVQLQNANSEPQTAWQDLTLELYSTSEEGEFSLDNEVWAPVTQVVLTEGSQSATFYYKDGKVGNPTIGVKEYEDRGWDQAFQEQEVVGEAAGFEISCTTPHIAGEYFSVTITAKDEEGNVDELYSDEVTIYADYVSPEAGSMIITPERAGGFVDGVLTVDAMYPDCGIIEINVEDTGDPTKSGVSGQIVFIPDYLTLSSETPQVVGKDFYLTITAYNKEDKVTPNYMGPTELEYLPISPEEIAGGVFVPGTVEEEDFEGGEAEIEVSFNRCGTIQIKARDKENPTQEGLSEEIEFRPDALVVDVETPSEERDFFYTGENMNIIISAIDAGGAAIPNYSGNVLITPTAGLSMPDSYQFLEGDAGVHTFVTSTELAGTYTVEALDEATGLRGLSPEIKVTEATIVVEDTYAPVGTSTEVIITITDDAGNIIPENSLTVIIELGEQFPNSSAMSSGLYYPVVFEGGKARIIVSNTEAEEVTISPKADYKFKIKEGTVTFGKITKTGVGEVLWREIKE